MCVIKPYNTDASRLTVRDYSNFPSANGARISYDFASFSMFDILYDRASLIQ